MQYTMLLISILEGFYIIYMFVFFKTRYSLEIGRELGPAITKFLHSFSLDDITKILQHPTTRSAEPESQICPFGKIASVFIFVFLVLRHFIPQLKKASIYVIALVFLVCFLNYNAVLYMLPVLFFELWMHFSKTPFF